MGIRAEIKQAMEEGRLYDFVANNQHRLSKDDLVRLVMEYEFKAYQACGSDAEALKVYNKEIISNLEDYDYFDEED